MWCHGRPVGIINTQHTNDSLCEWLMLQEVVWCWTVQTAGTTTIMTWLFPNTGYQGLCWLTEHICTVLSFYQRWSLTCWVHRDQMDDALKQKIYTRNRKGNFLSWRWTKFLGLTSCVIPIIVWKMWNILSFVAKLTLNWSAHFKWYNEAAQSE